MLALSPAIDVVITASILPTESEERSRAPYPDGSTFAARSKYRNNIEISVSSSVASAKSSVSTWE
jgi:hypothetical protein